MQKKKLLIKLIKIYEPGGIDWMGFYKCSKNYYTYHHIIKKADGGRETLENGAILTVEAHHILHTLEYVNPKLYFRWTLFFQEINRRNSPLDEELINIREELKNETICFIEEYNKYRLEIGKKRVLYQTL